MLNKISSIVLWPLFNESIKQIKWSSRLSAKDYRTATGDYYVSFILSALYMGGLFFIFTSDSPNNINSLLSTDFILNGLPVFLFLAVALIWWVYLVLGGIKIAVARWHDFNLSAWWLLLTVILLTGLDAMITGGSGYFFFILSLSLFLWKRDNEENKFGTQMELQFKSNIIRTIKTVVGWIVVVGPVILGLLLLSGLITGGLFYAFQL